MRKLIVLNTLTDQEKERNKKRLWEAAELKKSHTTVPYPARPRTLHTPHSSPPRLNRWSVQQHILPFFGCAAQAARLGDERLPQSQASPYGRAREESSACALDCADPSSGGEAARAVGERTGRLHDHPARGACASGERLSAPPALAADGGLSVPTQASHHSATCARPVAQLRS
jgi:hypothetical protein